DPASNAGPRPNPRNPWGASQKGRMAASLAPYRSMRDMRVSRSLPSAPSDSTRGPLQYFNSLLGAFSNIDDSVLIRAVRRPYRAGRTFRGATLALACILGSPAD